jgi:hypothetical protein
VKNKDKNLCSISTLKDDAGNPTRHILVNYDNSCKFYELGEIIKLGVIDGRGYDDALKVSGAFGANIYVEKIYGGREDCIDINHSNAVVVNVGTMVAMGKYFATVKGASNNIAIYCNELIGRGKETDFDFGNNSDQGNGITRNCVLRLYNPSFSVKVRTIFADFPEVIGCKLAKEFNQKTFGKFLHKIIREVLRVLFKIIL